MTDQSAPRNIRVIVRALRIWTGLILLAFVSTHLLNASLGVISLEAMDVARPYLTGFWGAPPLAQVLVISLLIHFFLGLWSVYERPTLQTTTQDMVQLGTSLLVVPTMAVHVIGISMAGNAGLSLDYAATIRLMWIDNPGIGLLQIFVVTIVWLHGCAGLLTWLRSMESARNVILWIYPIAIAIPVLSLLGFSEAGRDVLEAAALPVAAEAEPVVAADDAPPLQIDFALIKSVTNWVIWASAFLAVATLVARAIRIRFQSGAAFSIVRDGGDPETASIGFSLLDAFQSRNVPHASLCQGRGRCGTCAVRVLSSDFPIPQPSELELRTLAQKGLPEDARLACQLKPSGGRVTVHALYPADYTFRKIDDDAECTATVTSSEGAA